MASLVPKVHGRGAQSGAVPQRYDGSRPALAALKDMTSRLIGRFVVAVEEATRAEHGPGPLTRYSGRLVVPTETRAECAVLKAVAAHYVMQTEARRTTLSRQRELVTELFTALEARPERSLDAMFLDDWRDAADDTGRARAIADQVASLTDGSALAWHARLS